MSLVRIQQIEHGEWKNIKITRIQTSDEEVVVLGKPFRILVDDIEVYKKGGKTDG